MSTAPNAVDLRFERSLENAEKFFMKAGKVHRAMLELARRLDGAGIPYAVAGAMALSAHGYERMTTDVAVPQSASFAKRLRCTGSDGADQLPDAQRNRHCKRQRAKGERFNARTRATAGSRVPEGAVLSARRPPPPTAPSDVRSGCPHACKSARHRCRDRRPSTR